MKRLWQRWLCDTFGHPGWVSVQTRTVFAGQRLWTRPVCARCRR